MTDDQPVNSTADTTGAATKTSDRLALTAFVSSFFALLCCIGLPIALVTGIWALKRNNFVNPARRKLAIWALIIAPILAIIAVIGIPRLVPEPSPEQLAARAAASASAAAEEQARQQAEAAQAAAEERARREAEASEAAQAATEEQARREAEASKSAAEDAARREAEASAAAQAVAEEQARREAAASEAARASAEASAAAEQQAKDEGRYVGAEREKALRECARRQGGRCQILARMEFVGVRDPKAATEPSLQPAAIEVRIVFENVGWRPVDAFEGKFRMKDPFGDTVNRTYTLAGTFPVNLGADLIQPLPRGGVSIKRGTYTYTSLELANEYREVATAINREMKGYTAYYILDRIKYSDGSIRKF